MSDIELNENKDLPEELTKNELKLTSKDIKVKKNWFIDLFKNKKKRLWLIIGIVVLILLAGAGYDYYYLTHKIAPTLSQNTTTAPTTPTKPPAAPRLTSTSSTQLDASPRAILPQAC